MQNPEQLIESDMCIVTLSGCGIRKLCVEFANCERNPHFVCGFHLLLRIPLTFRGLDLHLRCSLTAAESRTTRYNCWLRNPQQNKCADKIYVTGICTRNPRNFCKLNLLTFWNMFKGFSLESRTLQT